jgi:hypothetical protein
MQLCIQRANNNNNDKCARTTFVVLKNIWLLDFVFIPDTIMSGQFVKLVATLPIEWLVCFNPRSLGGQIVLRSFLKQNGARSEFVLVHSFYGWWFDEDNYY